MNHSEDNPAEEINDVTTIRIVDFENIVESDKNRTSLENSPEDTGRLEATTEKEEEIKTIILMIKKSEEIDQKLKT